MGIRKNRIAPSEQEPVKREWRLGRKWSHSFLLLAGIVVLTLAMTSCGRGGDTGGGNSPGEQGEAKPAGSALPEGSGKPAGSALPAGSDKEAEENVKHQAEEILATMTLEEKVGQMFIARCPVEEAVERVSRYHPGGYLLFARDFKDKTKEQVIGDIRSYQEASQIPLLIGVDEEGGKVNRISRDPAFRSEPFLSPQELYQEGGWERIASDTVEKCAFLAEWGINVNFAPVCDVTTDPEAYMYPRAFGMDGEQTSRYVRTVVEAMKENGMGCVLKHFPGYGDNADTHTGIARDDRPYSTFEESDFLPFQAGIHSGAPMVLVAHNIVNCVDSQHPASLSAKMHEILREKLGFDGVIVTDDLFMGAIKEFAAVDQVAVLAVQAGNDLLCCTDFEVQIPAVIAAVNRGDIAEERIDQSVLRILKMKIEMGLI